MVGNRLWGDDVTTDPTGTLGGLELADQTVEGKQVGRRGRGGSGRRGGGSRGHGGGAAWTTGTQGLVGDERGGGGDDRKSGGWGEGGQVGYGHGHHDGGELIASWGVGERDSTWIEWWCRGRSGEVRRNAVREVVR